MADRSYEVQWVQPGGKWHLKRREDLIWNVRRLGYDEKKTLARLDAGEELKVGLGRWRKAR